MQIVQSLLEKIRVFHKPGAKVMTTLFATILITCGKVNFTNFSRYSALSEKTYRRQFHRQFDKNPLSFLLLSVKRRPLNDHLLDIFISKLGLSPTVIKSHPNYQNLGSYAIIAA